MDKRLAACLYFGMGFLFLFFVFLKFPIFDVFKQFSDVSFRLVMLFIIASLGIMVCHTWRWWIIIRSLGYYVPFLSLFCYKLSGFGMSFVLPGPRIAGDPLRAKLLGRKGVPFSDGLTSVTIDRTIIFGSSGVFFFIGIILLLVNFALPTNLRYLLFLAGLVTIGAVVVFFYYLLKEEKFFIKIFKFFRLHKLKILKNIEKNLDKIESDLEFFFKKNRKYFILSMFISLFTWVFMYFEYKFSTTILGYDFNLLSVFLIFSFVGIALMFPIPMTLGTLELSQISVFTILGIDKSAGLALSLIIRTRDTIWALIGFIFIMIYGLKIKDTLVKIFKNNGQNKEKIQNINIKSQ
ncbi:flippase-like domain-containing protein [Candidatus Woesearchaeota archaeon]|nr:flippase-like domain-containing protein [Candidatus Woesearchaeota archaeon]